MPCQTIGFIHNSGAGVVQQRTRLRGDFSRLKHPDPALPAA